MDPEAVYRHATDTDNEEPEWAALDLLVWLAGGGYAPNVGYAPAPLARRLEQIIIDALERA